MESLQFVGIFYMVIMNEVSKFCYHVLENSTNTTEEERGYTTCKAERAWLTRSSDEAPFSRKARGGHGTHGRIDAAAKLVIPPARCHGVATNYYWYVEREGGTWSGRK
jgi:hypothetical protein